MKQKGGLPRRYKAFFVITASLAGILLLIFAQTMLFPPDARQPKANLLQADRGPILDRNGRILAVSSNGESATVWRPQVDDLAKLSQLVGPVLGEDPADILTRLTNGGDFQYLKRKLTVKEAAGIRELKAEGALHGVRLEPEPARSYPESEIASPVVGYVGIDNVGLAGIEYSFNDVLSPTVRAGTGPQTGSSVWLTLDSVFQHEVQTIADAARDLNKAKRVNILVEQARTGDLLAWVTSPTYDPNHFSSYPLTVRSNAILTRAYEPGSVFKMFSLSTMLNAGVLKTTDTFDANGYYQHIVPGTGEVIRINDLGVYGWIDVEGILEHSSNAGAGYASDKIDSDTFEKGLRGYGFGTQTGIPLAGETPGLLRPNSTWSARSKPTIAIGQEIGVSALQMIQAATALANDGVMLRPRLVSKITSSSGEVLTEYPPVALRRVVSADVANEMLSMLTKAADIGTGHRAEIAGYSVAGKTGTAQVTDAKTGRYSDDNYIASILLFLPAEKPQYIVYVTIEEPMGASYLGGQIAAPVARTVLEKIIALRGLPSNSEVPITHPGSATFDPAPALIIGKQLPDFTGLSKRALLPLLNRPGLNVQFLGEGWVVHQNPAPGTPLTDGMKITVQFQ